MTTEAGLRLAGVVAQARRRLQAAGCEEAAADARILAAAAFGLDRAGLLAARDRPVGPAEEAALDVLIRRRAQGEPVACILGEREFWSLPFRLGPATLVPRPETETVVEVALERCPRAARILDLGTGSGCILLALLAELPDARGLGIDIDENALVTARDNARHLGLDGRALFRRGDWDAGLDERFDLVVSNPPYIASAEIAGLARDVRDHDPIRALDGGPDGLDAYRRIAGALPRLLVPGAVAVIEIGLGQAEAVAGLLAAAGMAEIGAAPDLSGRSRVVSCRRPVEKEFGFALGCD